VDVHTVVRERRDHEVAVRVAESFYKMVERGRRGENWRAGRWPTPAADGVERLF
jgi:hypothetical protein